MILICIKIQFTPVEFKLSLFLQIDSYFLTSNLIKDVVLSIQHEPWLFLSTNRFLNSSFQIQKFQLKISALKSHLNRNAINKVVNH